MAWKGYVRWLERQVGEERLFSSNVTLKDVYVPLNAYWDDVSLPGRVVRHIVSLENDLLGWVNSYRSRDDLRFVCGGPGYGKSSCARMLAYKLNQQEQIRALYIPLHRIQLDKEISITDQLKQDYGGGILDFSDILNSSAAVKVVLFLDGLDELAMKGASAEAVAVDFVRTIKVALTRHNIVEPRVLAVVGGRDLIIQALPESLATVTWHLLPYGPSENRLYMGSNPMKVEVSGGHSARLDDPNFLLDCDLRHEWWQAYGKATGNAYEGIPLPLQRDEFRPLTALPLLNFLVAFLYEESRQSLLLTTEVDVAYIYQALLKCVYRRVWGDELPDIPRNRYVNLTEADFYGLMEEAAVAAWHQGGNRAVSVSSIVRRCRNANLHEKWGRLERHLTNEDTSGFVGDRDNGATDENVLRLCTAFYSRWTDYGEQTMEFTHKSFADYLVANAIVRAWRETYVLLSQGEAWRHAIKPMLDVYGPTPLDRYIVDFLFRVVRGEHSRGQLRQLNQWQETLADVVGRFILDGIPLEGRPTCDSQRVDFPTELAQARNIAETTLALLSACARVTQRPSRLRWADSYDAVCWLRFLHSDSKRRYSMANHFLNHIVFNTDGITQNLEFTNLCRANLSGSSLEHVDLRGARLVKANLTGAKLYRANLGGCNLHKADLRGADLTGAFDHQTNYNLVIFDSNTLWPRGIPEGYHVDKTINTWHLPPSLKQLSYMNKESDELEQVCVLVEDGSTVVQTTMETMDPMIF